MVHVRLHVADCFSVGTEQNASEFSAVFAMAARACAFLDSIIDMRQQVRLILH